MQSLQGYFNGPQWDFVHVGLEKASKALRFKNKEKKQTTSLTKGKKMGKSNKKTKNNTIKSDMVNASVAASAAVVDISSSPAPQ